MKKQIERVKNMALIKRMLFKVLCNTILYSKTIIEPEEVFYFCKDEVKFIFKSSNRILYTPVGYFRFCDPHYSAYKNLEYVSKLYLEVNQLTKTTVDCIFKLLGYRNRFVTQLRTYGANSPIVIFFKTSSLSSLGFSLESTSIDANSIMELKNYLWFAKNEVFFYDKNAFFYKYNTFNASRSLAEEAIARLLGQGHLFTKSKFVKMNIEGVGSFFGTLSSIAPGAFYHDIEGHIKNRLTPKIQRELSILNVLDVICFEQDHRPGNYHLVERQKKIDGICSLDNDYHLAFYPSCKVSISTSAHTTPLVINGKIQRPYLDKQFVETLSSLTYKDVKQALDPYLNCMQIFFCWFRIRKIVRAIASTPTLILLYKDQWSQETMNYELSLDNCFSYLQALVKRDTAWKDGEQQETDKFNMF